jgi:hypothetical protein
MGKNFDFSKPNTKIPLNPLIPRKMQLVLYTVYVDLFPKNGLPKMQEPYIFGSDDSWGRPRWVERWLAQNSGGFIH